MSLVVPEPSSLVAVDDQCSMVEEWAEQCESVPELRDAMNRLGAIDEYLSRTSREGRARVAATMRRLEVRIGHLLGPPKPGERTDINPSSAIEGLSKDERHQFRQMAANEQKVEETIAQSTDTQPASRRRALDNIRSQRQPSRPELTRDVLAAVLALDAALTRLQRAAADDRFRHNTPEISRLHYHDLTRIRNGIQKIIDQLPERHNPE